MNICWSVSELPSVVSQLLTQVYMEYGEEDKLFEAARVALPNRDRLRGDGWLDEKIFQQCANNIAGMYGNKWYYQRLCDMNMI